MSMADMHTKTSDQVDADSDSDFEMLTPPTIRPDPQVGQQDSSSAVDPDDNMTDEQRAEELKRIQAENDELFGDYDDDEHDQDSPFTEPDDEETCFDTARSPSPEDDEEPDIWHTGLTFEDKKAYDWVMTLPYAYGPFGTTVEQLGSVMDSQFMEYCSPEEVAEYYAECITGVKVKATRLDASPLEKTARKPRAYNQDVVFNGDNGETHVIPASRLVDQRVGKITSDLLTKHAYPIIGSYRKIYIAEASIEAAVVTRDEHGISWVSGRFIIPRTRDDDSSAELKRFVGYVDGSLLGEEVKEGTVHVGMPLKMEDIS